MEYREKFYNNMDEMIKDFDGKCVVLNGLYAVRFLQANNLKCDINLLGTTDFIVLSQINDDEVKVQKGMYYNDYTNVTLEKDYEIAQYICWEYIDEYIEDFKQKVYQIAYDQAYNLVEYLESAKSNLSNSIKRKAFKIQEINETGFNILNEKNEVIASLGIVKQDSIWISFYNISESFQNRVMGAFRGVNKLLIHTCIK